MTKDYIYNRLEEQQQWFSKKSSRCKNYFHIFSLVSIIGSLLVPALGEDCPLESRIIALLVAISIGVNEHYKFQLKWKIYRDTSEMLKSEKFKFENSVGEYDQKNEAEKNKVLVERIEAIIEKAHESWSCGIFKNSEKGN